MLKMYGSHICSGCRETFERFEKENVPYELVDITLNVANLREFLALRTHNDLFAEVREQDRIGIPFFVVGDRMTFEADEALAWAAEEI